MPIHNARLAVGQNGRQRKNLTPPMYATPNRNKTLKLYEAYRTPLWSSTDHLRYNQRR